MENTRKIGRIPRNKSQRALPIECLETIKQLAGDFQVRLHPEPDENQFVHFIRRSNGERGGTNPRDNESRYAFPDRQTADGALLESLIVTNHANDAGNIAARLDQDELASLSRLICGSGASDAHCVMRQIQSRS